jgi:hypothetical protein
MAQLRGKMERNEDGYTPEHLRRSTIIIERTHGRPVDELGMGQLGRLFAMSAAEFDEFWDHRR